MCNTIEIYYSFSPVANKVDAKLLNKQVFTLDCGYFKTGAKGL